MRKLDLIEGCVVVKKIKRSKTVGDIGEITVSLVFRKSLGWIYRGQPLLDVGIDGNVEICNNDANGDSMPTGKILGVQVKSGDSAFEEKCDEGWVYRGEPNDLEYWLDYSVPVIIVLCDTEKEIGYWQVISKETVESTGKGWKVSVPEENTIDSSSKISLESLAEGSPSIQRFRRLQASLPWMRALERGDDLYLRVTVFTNKVIPRGYVRLYSGANGEGVELFEWFFLWSDMETLFSKLRSFFPWATFSFDSDANSNEDQEREWLLEEIYDEHHGCWGDGEIVCYDMEYADFCEQYEGMSLEKIRLTREDIEGFERRYKMKLSQIGEAFLSIGNYLEHGT